MNELLAGPEARRERGSKECKTRRGSFGQTLIANISVRTEWKTWKNGGGQNTEDTREKIYIIAIIIIIVIINLGQPYTREQIRNTGPTQNTEVLE